MIPVPTQKIAKLVVKMRHYDIHPIYLPDVDYLYGETHPLYPIIEDVKRYIKNNYREESEVLKTYPELARYEDVEGLIPLGTPGFVPAGTGGGIYYKDHLL